jgi:hypothetical protein
MPKPTALQGETKDIIRTIRHSVEWHHGSGELAYSLEIHLSLEAALTLLLELAVRYPRELDFSRMPFAEKARWVFALGLLPPELRTAVQAINKMRNSLAHRFGHTIDDNTLVTICQAAPHLGIDIAEWFAQPDPHGHPIVYPTERVKTEKTAFHIAEQLVLRVLTACEALDELVKAPSLMPPPDDRTTTS